MESPMIDAVEGVIIFLILLCLIALVGTDEANAQEQVRYCYDRSSYPVKVAIVCPTCQCPAGFY